MPVPASDLHDPDAIERGIADVDAAGAASDGLGTRLVHIEEPRDARLRDYVSLTDMQLRTRTEPEAGLFIAEGEKVIERAVDAGYPMRSMLLSDKWLPTMAPVLARTSAPVYVGASDLLEQVTGFHVHRGALAAMGRLPLRDPAELLER